MRVQLQIGNLIDVVIHRLGSAIRHPCGKRERITARAGRGCIWACSFVRTSHCVCDRTKRRGCHDAHNHPIPRSPRARTRRNAVSSLMADCPDLSFAVSRNSDGNTGQSSAERAATRHACSRQVSNMRRTSSNSSCKSDRYAITEASGATSRFADNFMRKRAVAVPRFEQADGFQRAQRVTDRTAANSKSLRQMAFRWQRLAGGESPVQHQYADPVGHFLGNARLLDRCDQTEVVGRIRERLTAFRADGKVSFSSGSITYPLYHSSS